MANTLFPRFHERAYTTTTELLQQQVDLFNAASGGAIVLRAQPMVSDYQDSAFYKKLNGLVLRRNAYDDQPLTALNLEMLTETAVKVGAGTPPVNMNPNDLEWLQRDPDEMAAVYALQLAPEMLADMLNVAIAAAASAIKTAHTAPAPLVYDKSNILNNQALTNGDLVEASSYFGDQAQRLRTWVMHSAPLHKLYQQNLSNLNQLFDYGNVRIVADIFGRNFIITDSPSLIVAGTPAVYRTLGLAENGIIVGQNGDLRQNIDVRNGRTNITANMQSEWSYNLQLKGYAWDKTNGGASPSNAALALGTNWDKVATNNKDTCGVMLETELVNAAT